MSTPRVSKLVALIGLLALLVGGVLLRLLVAGGGEAGWLAWPESGVVAELRGLRAATALTVGAALALAGVLLQALLRNPLASPDLIGVSSGASLAVVISGALAGASAAGGVMWHAAPALVGALLALALVFSLGQRRGLIDPVSLVLVGVIVSVLCGAGVLFVQHLRPDGTLGGARAIIGAFSDETPWSAVGVVAAATLAGLVAAMVLGPTLDAASLGDDEAASVGVPVAGLRFGLFVNAGMLTAGAVVLAGPIGFVGLIAPHLARLLVGPAHRGLAPAAALIGATILLLADAGVRLVDLGSGRMPIGIVTALIGGPVLLWMLRGERRET